MNNDLRDFGIVNVTDSYLVNLFEKGSKATNPLLDDLRNKLTKCLQGDAVFYCEPNSHRKGYKYKCGLRICEKCSSIRRGKLWAKYKPIVDEMKNPKLLTLTIKGHHYFTKENKRKFDRYVRNLFRRLERKYKRKIGGIVVLELLKRDVGFYWHYHCLIDVGYLRQQTLSKLWKEITKTSYIVHIRKARGKSGLNYILKYITKPLQFFSWPPTLEDLKFYATSMHKTRFVTAISVYYNYEPKKIGFNCEECGCSYRYAGIFWRQVIEELFRDPIQMELDSYFGIP